MADVHEPWVASLDAVFRARHAAVLAWIAESGAARAA